MDVAGAGDNNTLAKLSIKAQKRLDHANKLLDLVFLRDDAGNLANEGNKDFDDQQANIIDLYGFLTSKKRNEFY